MTSSDDLNVMICRNKLLGMWAAEKMGLTGHATNTYSDALAVAAIDPEKSDVFTKLRTDFDEAGMTVTDEEILHMIREFTVQIGSRIQPTGGGAPDALAVTLARNLKSQ